MELQAAMIDEELIAQIRRLNSARLIVYTDFEIMTAWKAKGLALVAAAPNPATADVITQAETLKKLADAIATHIDHERADKASRRYQRAFAVNDAATNFQLGAQLCAQTAINTNAALAAPIVGTVVVVEPPPPPHDWHRHGRTEFCHGCALRRVDAEILNCPCKPNPNAAQDIEHQIRTLTLYSKEATAARVRMVRMESAEKTGNPWTPKGTRLFPVERWPRRYEDVVGGWNKRAVK